MTKRPARGSILVGDIGGTNARLSLYDAAGKKALAKADAPSRSRASFEEIALEFLASTRAKAPNVAVLGVAGPVKNRTAAVTNVGWKLDERALAKKLSIPKVVLVNDLVVAARGCLHVEASSVASITEAKPSPKGKNVAVIAAGTGLGQARLVWDGRRHLALGTEGGHGDFAPVTPLQIELWHFLSGRFPDHVSYERILSGDGLGALYDFFASRAGREPRAITKRLAEAKDRNRAIAEIGLAREHRPAALAVDLFASIYGAEAGNMALRELPFGGLFVTGAIGGKIVPARRELFLEAFRKKGRFSGMLGEIPIAVVLDPHVGVVGALATARELLSKARDSAEADDDDAKA